VIDRRDLYISIDVFQFACFISENMSLIYVKFGSGCQQQKKPNPLRYFQSLAGPEYHPFSSFVQPYLPDCDPNDQNMFSIFEARNY
jgi:hypothetical protein